MHPFKLRLSTLITAVVALALLAVAIDWNAHPGVAEAAAPNIPEGLTATSGDGTMKLVWTAGSGGDDATGYQYRYSNQAQGLFEVGGALLPCNNPCFRSEWLEASTTGTGTDKTIGSATGDLELTVGTTYYFQVRAKNNDGESAPSATASAMQRAAPIAITDLAAAAGNAEVTLTWTHLADYNIVN